MENKSRKSGQKADVNEFEVESWNSVSTNLWRHLHRILSEFSVLEDLLNHVHLVFLP